MKEIKNSFINIENNKINLYTWEPKGKIKAIVQIAHGMAETAIRYKRFAKTLTQEGFLVTANDHRGHGNSANSIEELGRWGSNGFEGCVQDLFQINQQIYKKYQKPIILFGHSMGSFMAQRYIQEYGDTVDGAILCGSNGKKSKFLINSGLTLARLERFIYDADRKSELLNKMSFGQYNTAFKPTKTEFDWLSRDEKEVQKYIKDPYCGTIFPTQFYIDFLKGLKEISKKRNLKRVPKDLPIFIISGSKDPVGENGSGVQRLYESYKANNMRDVKIKLYQDARHELLNEINQKEVTNDIIAWLVRSI